MEPTTYNTKKETINVYVYLTKTNEKQLYTIATIYVYCYY